MRPGKMKDWESIFWKDRVRENPAWSNAAVTDLWSQLERRVGKKRMPLRRGSKYREYGAGRYGVVLPTGQTGVVLKLTTDKSEAMAAAWLARQRRPLPGIARYYDVLELPVKHRGRTVYALWREEAHYVGGIRYHKDSKRDRAQFRTENKLLSTATSTAQSLVQRLTDDPRKIDAFAVVAREAHARVKRIPLKSMVEEFLRLDTLRAGHGTRTTVERVLLGARLLSRGKILNRVGDAMTTAFERGVFLADVHDGNIGMVTRGKKTFAVITDPGNAIPVSRKFGATKIESIRARQRS